jgi:3-hydroxymyristoyl/3-hydroxydecanoyl-(acyl carrier protein) dehydratase
MKSLLTKEQEDYFFYVKKNVLHPEEGGISVDLGLTEIEKVLPQRKPLLLIDHVSCMNMKDQTITAEYQVEENKDGFSGHFPNYPIWPGVLQVEAIGQAGFFLYMKQMPEQVDRLFLYHIAQAQFLQPINPPGKVIIHARSFNEDPLFIIVGQCIYNNQICSAVALKGIK